MNYTNDCDKNFPMNRFNECTMDRNKVDGSCSNVIDGNATIMREAEMPPPPPPTTATTAAAVLPNQSKPNTLILQFSHSTNTCTAMVSNDDDTINSPLDIYRKFGKPLLSLVKKEQTGNFIWCDLYFNRCKLVRFHH